MSNSYLPKLPNKLGAKFETTALSLVISSEFIKIILLLIP
jgi:hypothetical protein